jgi:glycosyltransferase involved in cell wall biosynthesis
MPDAGSRPKVSVCVITYNQEPYIRECLQSIVDQETDFAFEVIVAVDCGTDATRTIVEEFAHKHPNKVRPLFNDRNIGPFPNYHLAHTSARGEYVAHVDGDDSTFPGKLAKQARFLDEHSNCHLVAHKVAVVDEHGRTYSTKSLPQSIDLANLLYGHPMFLHSSIMYRRDTVNAVFYTGRPFIDFYMYIYAAALGPIGFINECLGLYRSNVGLSKKGDLMPYIEAAIDSAVGKVPDDVVSFARSKQYLSYAIAALLAGRTSGFRQYISLARKWNNTSPLIASLFHLRRMHWPIRQIIGLYKRTNLLRKQLGLIGRD